MALTRQKAEACLQSSAQLKKETHFILAADTVVVLQKANLRFEILGKPVDQDDAFRTLEKLSNRKHLVKTAVGVLESQNLQFHSFVSTTEVWFHRLSESQIKNYLFLDKPFDKAGSYGIQDQNHSFVAALCGSVSNVIGLPLPQTLALIKKTESLNT